MESFNNSTLVDAQPLYSPRPLQFSLLLSISIVSVPCFIFLLYHLLTTRALYTALSNHVIILLLISNGIQTCTDVPILLSYYYTGIKWPPSATFCVFSYFIDYYLFTTCFLLLTWASFERHILIFHSGRYNTRLRRLVGHYMPLGFCCVYPLIYYLVFLVLYPCENTYDESIANCALPCYLVTSDFLTLYEQIAHGFALILLVFIFNTLLLIRVWRQKHRMNLQITRSKNIRMMIQLLGICFIFLATNGGFFLVQLGQLLWDPNFGVDAAAWIYPFSMWMPPCVAFVCLGTLPDVRKHLNHRIFRKCRRRMVAPGLATLTRTV